VPERTPSDLWDSTAERAGEAWDAATGRAGELAATAATVSRVTVRQRLEAMRWAAPAVLQTAVGAAVAWFLADTVVGLHGAFFAPISATIALGLGYGQRTRRAVELAIGVAVGIAVAAFIIDVLGTGGWQIGVVVALAMFAAVGLGGQPLVVRQAATSAVLVATIAVPDDGAVYDRFLDALIGGAVAIVINLVVTPIDAVGLVRRTARPPMDALAGALDELAVALRDHDTDATIDALTNIREVEGPVRTLLENVRTGTEAARYAPLRRRQRPEMARLAQAMRQLDIAQRDARALARAVLRAVRRDAHVPPEAVASIHDLAEAVRGLRDELLAPEGTAPGAAREAALRAVARTTVALEQTSNLAVCVIGGSVRSTAVALLRGMGLEPEEARNEVRRVTAEIEAER
jgi:uncharacterized membrane protein YgaE (UPF0421/DUF939 family)